MPADAVYEDVAERLRDGFRRHQSRRDTREADARLLMVEPALTALGYPGSSAAPSSGRERTSRTKSATPRSA